MNLTILHSITLYAFSFNQNKKGLRDSGLSLKRSPFFLVDTEGDKEKIMLGLLVVLAGSALVLTSWWVVGWLVYRHKADFYDRWKNDPNRKYF